MRKHIILFFHILCYNNIITKYYVNFFRIFILRYYINEDDLRVINVVI